MILCKDDSKNLDMKCYLAFASFCMSTHGQNNLKIYKAYYLQ